MKTLIRVDMKKSFVRTPGTADSVVKDQGRTWMSVGGKDIPGPFRIRPSNGKYPLVTLW